MSWVKGTYISALSNGKALFMADKVPVQCPPVESHVMMQIVSVRSGRMQRYYWSLLGKVVDATELWHSKEALHNWLKLQLGLYREFNFNGQTVVHMESTDEACLLYTSPSPRD